MNKNKALINVLLNHFSMHNARVVLMVEIILSLIKISNVQQRKIAQGTSFTTKISSTVRRIQRFFAKQALCQNAAINFIFSLFNWDDKIVIILDRTNWKFGKFDINFLVASAIYKNYSIPLCWLLLPHKGNSKTYHRITLLNKLFKVVPIDRIEWLLADREFIGAKWFEYLKEQNIPFCIRIKESSLVHDTHRGGMIKLSKLFRMLSVGQCRELHQNISGITLRIAGTRMKNGELLILALFKADNLNDIFELYARRWTIETMFKAFKSAGFNFEDTHQKNHERLCKMMILLTIAYSWAIIIGKIKNEIVPIKLKKHGRPEFSLFSYGFRTIQTIYLKSHKISGKLITLLESICLKKTIHKCLAEISVVY